MFTRVIQWFNSPEEKFLKYQTAIHELIQMLTEKDEIIISQQKLIDSLREENERYRKWLFDDDPTKGEGSE